LSKSSKEVLQTTAYNGFIYYTLDLEILQIIYFLFNLLLIIE